jgi:hypothetical protein
VNLPGVTTGLKLGIESMLSLEGVDFFVAFGFWPLAFGFSQAMRPYTANEMVCGN